MTCGFLDHRTARLSRASLNACSDVQKADFTGTIRTPSSHPSETGEFTNSATIEGSGNSAEQIANPLRECFGQCIDSSLIPIQGTYDLRA